MSVHIYIYIYYCECCLAEYDENSTSRYTSAVVIDDAINNNAISALMARTYSFVYVQTDDLHAGVS